MKDDDRMLARLNGMNSPSVKNTPSPNATREARSGVASQREQALRTVFTKFDLDSSGVIEAKELLALGKARRTLGQKSRLWSEDKNDALVQKLDFNGDGKVPHPKAT